MVIGLMSRRVTSNGCAGTEVDAVPPSVGTQAANATSTLAENANVAKDLRGMDSPFLCDGRETNRKRVKPPQEIHSLHDVERQRRFVEETETSEKILRFSCSINRMLLCFLRA